MAAGLLLDAYVNGVPFDAGLLRGQALRNARLQGQDKGPDHIAMKLVGLAPRPN